MKIAIRGHESRGKEVIQIFKDLGTEGLMDHTGSHIDWVYLRDDFLRPNQLIVGTDVAFLKGYNYKVYTLEEFEKEFSFKIGDKVIFPVKTGWASGKITGLTYVGDQLKYEVDNRIGGYHYVEPHKLSLYPMKEERNITLTLEKAKEWYKKGGELKEIALQAFTEKELNPLPRSWEEFCKRYPIKKDESYINSEGKILSFTTKTARRDWNHICPSKKSAEAHLAMMQLEQLRDCWRQGWEPTKCDTGCCITHYPGKYSILSFSFISFLSFPTRKMAEEFLECFKDLIEQAGDLI